MTFDIKRLNRDAEDLEQLGTKEKFWFFYQDDKDTKWLFKYSRKDTGEHWSEKVAEALCEELHIPHVIYELAIYRGSPGVVTRNVIPENCRMVMGNEVLHKNSSVYPHPENGNERFAHVKEHTLNRVLTCLDSKTLPPNINRYDTCHLSAADVFCGYLLLDTLISNQDRHHENWAIIVNQDTREQHLCPSYDHAASLGRELLDTERHERLTTQDINRKIQTFVRKARSELFRSKIDKKPLLTIDAFYIAVEKRSTAKSHWLAKLRGLNKGKILTIFSRIPSEMITKTAKKFAIEMTLENRKRLLEDERA